MEVYQTMARSPGSAGKPYWEHTPSLGEGFIGRDHPANGITVPFAILFSSRDSNSEGLWLKVDRRMHTPSVWRESSSCRREQEEGGPT